MNPPVVCPMPMARRVPKSPYRASLRATRGVPRSDYGRTARVMPMST